MEGIHKALYLLRYNPRLFWKKLIARPNVYRKFPREPFQRRIGRVLFEFDTRDDVVMWEACRNLYELEVLDILRRYVPKGGVYLDVGANVGFLAAVAADAAGPEGEVHAFEPVPRNFQRLRRLAELNPDYAIHAHPWAIGGEDGTATMTLSNTTNQGLHTIVSEILPEAWMGERISVPLRRLDRYIEDHVRRPIAFIKIDTEGYEFPVLEGLSASVGRGAHRPVILVEVTPDAWAAQGIRMEALTDWICRHGYRAMNPLHPPHAMDTTAITKQVNLLLLPAG